jgi:hypothetical protein
MAVEGNFDGKSGDLTIALQQFASPGKVGQYFAPIGSTALESGLTITDQSPLLFQNDTAVSALQSITRPDYLYPQAAIVPGSGAGRGTQFFLLRQRAHLSPFSEVRRYPVFSSSLI